LGWVAAVHWEATACASMVSKSLMHEASVSSADAR
jgi:hypothetical protein